MQATPGLAAHADALELSTAVAGVGAGMAGAGTVTGGAATVGAVRGTTGSTRDPLIARCGCFTNEASLELCTLVRVAWEAGTSARDSSRLGNTNTPIASACLVRLCCHGRCLSNNRAVRSMRRMSTSAPFVARLG